MYGLYREGDMWFIAGYSNGNWTMNTVHDTQSSFETAILRSEDLSQNLRFQNAIVTYEPLPSGGSVALQARQNAETSWTTLKTITTTGHMKMNVAWAEAVNALNGLDKTKQIQFRIQVSSTGTSPVILTGFKVELTPVPDQANG
jgi:hypothetical protein